MRKTLAAAVLVVAAIALAVWYGRPAPASPPSVYMTTGAELMGASPTHPKPQTRLTDEEIIVQLLEDLKTADVQSMAVVPATPFTLPTAGVHVMRVRLEETYDIQGVGRDTVELAGWIAVMHDNPQLPDGEKVLNWDTAVVPTEFVGLELKGESDIFGPVHVSLNRQHPCLGQVGGIDIPTAVAQRIERRKEEMRQASAL